MPRGAGPAPVYPGDTLTATSEVIGLRETSNGRSGVVWVRSTGWNQRGEAVLGYCRWVMVRKRDAAAPAPRRWCRSSRRRWRPATWWCRRGSTSARYDFALAGEPWRWGDYAVGERIDHVDRVTIEEAEHMLATRLWQNTAKVHFDVTQREDGRRLIYGGHVISLARALSFNGLANAQLVAAINAGAHANPCFAGDTVGAWSEVLDKAETAAPGVGALRLRTVAARPGAGLRAPRTRRGSTCRRCCSTSTTGCWCRCDGSLMPAALHSGKRLVPITLIQPDPARRRNFIRAGMRR